MTIDERLGALTMNLELLGHDLETQRQNLEAQGRNLETQRQNLELATKNSELRQDRLDQRLDRAVRLGVKEARRHRNQMRLLDAKATESKTALETQMQKLSAAQVETEHALQRFLASRTNGHNEETK